MSDETVVTLNPPHSQCRSTSNLKGAISMLFAAYPQNTNASMEDEAAKLSIYLEGLKDLPSTIVSETCRDLIQTSRFMPSVAEIRQRAHEIRDQATPTKIRETSGKLRHEQIERIVMTSDQGQRAMGIGCANTLLIDAEKNAKTEQQLRHWLAGIGEGYWAKRSKVITQNQALAGQVRDNPIIGKLWGSLQGKEEFYRTKFG